MPSTLTFQNIINFASTQLDLLPLTSVGGFTDEPALSLCNDTLQTIFAPPSAPMPGMRPLVLDWKFNRAEMNMFVTSPYRQDYLFAGATIFCQRGGAGIDLATNNALTISGSTVTIKTLETYTGTVGDVCYIRGTGSTYDSTFTQNGSTSVFGGNTYTITVINGLTLTATLTGSASGTSGSAGITDFGWLAAATMVDINNGGPILPTRTLDAVRDIQPYSQAGNPTKVAVIQDQGTGILKIRFWVVPGNQIWGINLVYQKKVSLRTAVSGATWSPVPDELSYVYRQGFLAKGYRYVNSARADAEEAKFMAALRAALGGDDREESNVGLVPETGLSTASDYWFYF